MLGDTAAPVDATAVISESNGSCVRLNTRTSTCPSSSLAVGNEAPGAPGIPQRSWLNTNGANVLRVPADGVQTTLAVAQTSRRGKRRAAGAPAGDTALSGVPIGSTATA